MNINPSLIHGIAHGYAKSDQIRQLGPQIYGAGWQSKMARDLNVNVRTVQRWVAGDRVPHDMVISLLKTKSFNLSP